MVATAATLTVLLLAAAQGGGAVAGTATPGAPAAAGPQGAPAAPPAAGGAARSSAVRVPANLLRPLPSCGAVPPIVDGPPDMEMSLFEARATQKGYAKQLKDLVQRAFHGAPAEARARGLAEVREFTDPASFLPMVEAFRHEKNDVRRAMLDHFSQQGEYGDAALAFVAITDPDPGMRHESTSRIERPACEAVVRMVDMALRDTRHEVVNNAGLLAGNLNILEAIPPMIFGQVASDPVRGQGDLAWIAVGTTTTYVANVVPVLGDNSGAYTPILGTVNEGVLLRVNNAIAYSYRTDLHESLVAMTSADFGSSTAGLGYDMKAWWTWFNETYVPFKQRQAEELARAEQFPAVMPDVGEPPAPPDAPAPKPPAARPEH